VSNEASDPQSLMLAPDPLGELKQLRQNVERLYREVADEHVQLCIGLVEANTVLESMQKTPTKKTS